MARNRYFDDGTAMSQDPYEGKYSSEQTWWEDRSFRGKLEDIGLGIVMIVIGTITLGFLGKLMWLLAKLGWSLFS